jgi:hypothetical protein
MVNNALGLTCLTNASQVLKTQSPAFSRAVRKQIRAAATQAGNDVETSVKEAYSAWSKSIPAAVKVTTRFNTNASSVRIIVDHNGNGAARAARPWELGNKVAFNEDLVADVTARLNAGRTQPVSRRKSIAESRRQYGGAAVSGQLLRWPVYHKRGEGGYAVAPTRPTFFPAVKASQAGTDLLMEKAIHQAAKDAGFKEGS